MRDLKFRACDIRHKKMFMVEAVYTDEPFQVGYEDDGETEFDPYKPKYGYRGRDETFLMQYAGLNDGTKWEELTEDERTEWVRAGNFPKEWKGKPIYEGDILSHKYYSNPVICGFEDGAFHTEDVSRSDNSLRVIGNIYENPELLKN